MSNAQLAVQVGATLARRFDLIVFDKDGTLIDMGKQAALWADGMAERMRCDGYDSAAVGAVFRNAGWDPERRQCMSTTSTLLCGSWEEINACAADVLTKIVSPVSGAVLTRREAEAKISEWIDDFGESLAHKPVPLVDLVQLFTRIHKTGCKIAICTADNRRNTECLFEEFPSLAQLVSHVSCADDKNEEAVKPNPMLLRSIMRRLGNIDPSRTMMVGDSHYDVKMGRGANCGMVVGVASTVEVDNVVKENADTVVSSVDEVESLLRVGMTSSL